MMGGRGVGGGQCGVMRLSSITEAALATCGDLRDATFKCRNQPACQLETRSVHSTLPLCPRLLHETEGVSEV